MLSLFAPFGGGGVDYRLKNYAFSCVPGDYIRTFLFKGK